MKNRISLLLVVLGCVAALSAATLINGAGATFPNPIYSKWFDVYGKAKGVSINYQSQGSGAGIRQVQAGTVDFGATDGPMTDEQLAQAKVKILHFPTVLGAVVITYNVPEAKGELDFTPEAIAGIFLGKITKWNDSAIAKANPKVKLPGNDIAVVHRAEASGTSYCFTDYLSKISPEWKSKVGTSVQVSWPVGFGGKGNEGVAGTIQQTPYSIGYVELIYALQNKMSYGRVRNSAGTFVHADLASTSAAAAAAANSMPDDFRVSITNPPGKAAYPIATFTWLLIPSKINDQEKKRSIVDFLKWMLADGQNYAEGLSYAKLPKEVVAKEVKAIALIQ